MASFDIIAGCQTLVTSLHDSAGLPWWAAIAASTVIVRSVTGLPLQLAVARRVARAESLRPVLQAWTSTLQVPLAAQTSKRADIGPAATRKLKGIRKRLFKEFRCSPSGSLALSAAQVPPFIVMSLAIRDLVGFPIPFLSSSTTDEVPVARAMYGTGLPWAEDLASVDPTLISPLLLGALTLVNSQMSVSAQALAASAGTNTTDKLASATSRFLSKGRFPAVLPLFVTYAAAHVPLALTLYWLSSGAYSLIVNLYLASQRRSIVS